MDLEKPFTSLAPPVFNGENYQLWAARMEAHLESNDLWEPVEEDYEVPQVTDASTMSQARYIRERKAKKSRARGTLLAAVSAEIFTRVMTNKNQNLRS